MNPSYTDTATIKLTIPDPCDPPTSITPSNPADQTYTISDNPYTYTVAPFTIVPSFCQVDYVATKTDLSDGSSAVTIQSSQLDFYIDYISSLVPVINGEEQTMTITATSKTKWASTPSSPVTASTDWVLDFLNPCIDTNFV